MSQKTPPTYSPPAPPTLATAGDLYGQAQNFYQNNGNGNLLTAQSTALNNVNDPNYYSHFQPTSLEQALGSQYFQNVWPNEQAMISNQFANSGMANSPALASTLGNAYGNLSTQVGSYLADQGNSRATNAINAGLNISPNSVLGPYVQTGQNQSNAQADLNYGYQQSLAQQQYQQQMNKYQNSNALAGTIGQISPIGGQIYGAATGTSGSAFGGTAQTLGQIAPYALSMASGGFGGGGGMEQSGVPNSSQQLNLFGGGTNYMSPGKGASNANNAASVY